MSHHNPCPHCHQPQLRRAPAWGIALVALTWAFVVAMLFIASLIGPFIMFFVPVIFAFGAAGVRTAHDIAFAPPECEACGKVALDEAPTIAPVRAVAPAMVRAA